MRDTLDDELIADAMRRAWLRKTAEAHPEPPKWATPGALARAIDPTTKQTVALDVIDAALVEAFNTPDSRLIIAMPPQEGKSERASRRFPLWALTQNPDLRIAIASFELNTARRWGRAIRDDIITHSDTLDLAIRADVSAQAEWQVAGKRGGVYSVGVGGPLTGRPVDLMIIDDPLKGHETADSETIREALWEWWTGTVATRFAPGAPVVVIQTRWHEDDLAGRLLDGETADRWKLVSIPAQCEDVETDPLGRTYVGEFMVSAQGRTQEQWEIRKSEQTTRGWAALYQQHPTPAEGAVWKESWIDVHRGKTGEVMHDLQRITVSVDPAATSKKTSDMTGIVVAGMDSHRRGWVLDDRTLRGSPIEWGSAVWEAVLDWNATDLVVEDNQGGEMVLEVLNAAWRVVTERRPTARLMPRIQRVHARQSKRTRAEAIAALYETGHVKHAADGTDRLAKLEHQMLSWTGEGDSPDRVDALVHGLTLLFQPHHTVANPARPQGVGRWGALRGR